MEVFLFIDVFDSVTNCEELIVENTTNLEGRIEGFGEYVQNELWNMLVRG